MKFSFSIPCKPHLRVLSADAKLLGPSGPSLVSLLGQLWYGRKTEPEAKHAGEALLQPLPRNSHRHCSCVCVSDIPHWSPPRWCQHGLLQVYHILPLLHHPSFFRLVLALARCKEAEGTVSLVSQGHGTQVGEKEPVGEDTCRRVGGWGVHLRALLPLRS